MTQELYSVDQVSERLGLHVRTVRNYVRDGRLKAVRIGKQYRIAQQDLDALTGQATAPPASNVSVDPDQRHADVSSIVQIDAIDFDAASRITNALMAAVKGRPGGDAPVRIDTIYDQPRARLKVMVTGSLETTASLLKFIHAYLKS